MIVNFMQKLIALILSALISAGIIAPVPIPPDGIKANANFVFESEEAGSAEGTAIIKANFDATYELYWGDAQGNKLTTSSPSGKVIPYSWFAQVDVKKGTGEKETNSFLAIPDGAETILLYYQDQLLDTDKIPEENIPDYGDMTYSFGTLSDVHFGRYFDDEGNDWSDTSYPQALNFLDDMGVSIVGVSGDLSYEGETSSYESFHKYNDQHDFNVFSCKGNHDCRDKFDYEGWKANVNVGVFSDNKPAGVLDVADNGYDFVYSGKETNGDVFIFFSQVKDAYVPFVQLVTDEQQDWLEAMLEKYKDKRVYLYFHTFLNAPKGNPFLGEGNIYNDWGLFYTIPYFKGNKDERRFRKLLEKYHNVVFFNGHSHWTYAMECYNPDLNISDYDGTTATMVHVSSSGAPRTTSFTHPTKESHPGTMSEGIYVKAYKDFIITNGCDFVNGQFLAYAIYKIDNR